MSTPYALNAARYTLLPFACGFVTARLDDSSTDSSVDPCLRKPTDSRPWVPSPPALHLLLLRSRARTLRAARDTLTAPADTVRGFVQPDNPGALCASLHKATDGIGGPTSRLRLRDGAPRREQIDRLTGLP